MDAAQGGALEARLAEERVRERADDAAAAQLCGGERGVGEVCSLEEGAGRRDAREARADE